MINVPGFFFSGHKGHHRGADSRGWKGGGKQQDCGCRCGQKLSEEWEAFATNKNDNAAE